MTELLTLDLVEKNYITDQLVLTIGYDIENLTNPKIRNLYDGEITKDFYGRETPKHAHGTTRLDHKTSSTKTISEAIIKLYDSIVNPILLVRRVNIAACNLVDSEKKKDEVVYQQFDLFSDTVKEEQKKKRQLEDEESEEKIQKAIIDIKRKYGKNSILKAMNLEEGGTTIERNNQVGGHKG